MMMDKEEKFSSPKDYLGITLSTRSLIRLTPNTSEAPLLWAYILSGEGARW